MAPKRGTGDISVKQEVYEAYRAHCTTHELSMRREMDKLIDGVLDGDLSSENAHWAAVNAEKRKRKKEPTFRESVREFASKNDKVPPEIRALSGVPALVEREPTKAELISTEEILANFYRIFDDGCPFGQADPYFVKVLRKDPVPVDVTIELGLPAADAARTAKDFKLEPQDHPEPSPMPRPSAELFKTDPEIAELDAEIQARVADAKQRGLVSKPTKAEWDAELREEALKKMRPYHAGPALFSPEGLEEAKAAPKDDPVTPSAPGRRDMGTVSLGELKSCIDPTWGKK